MDKTIVFFFSFCYVIPSWDDDWYFVWYTNVWFGKSIETNKWVYDIYMYRYVALANIADPDEMSPYFEHPKQMFRY